MSVWRPGPQPEPVELYRVAEDTLAEERLAFWQEILCLGLALGFCALVVRWIG